MILFIPEFFVEWLKHIALTMLNSSVPDGYIPKMANHLKILVLTVI